MINRMAAFAAANYDLNRQDEPKESSMDMKRILIMLVACLAFLFSANCEVWDWLEDAEDISDDLSGQDDAQDVCELRSYCFHGWVDEGQVNECLEYTLPAECEYGDMDEYLDCAEKCPDFDVDDELTSKERAEKGALLATGSYLKLKVGIR